MGTTTTKTNPILQLAHPERGTVESWQSAFAGMECIKVVLASACDFYAFPDFGAMVVPFLLVAERLSLKPIHGCSVICSRGHLDSIAAPLIVTTPPIVVNGYVGPEDPRLRPPGTGWAFGIMFKAIRDHNNSDAIHKIRRVGVPIDMLWSPRAVDEEHALSIRRAYCEAWAV